LIERTTESFRVDLQKFKTGETWKRRKKRRKKERRRKRRSRKNSELRANNGRTTAWLQHLRVLDETNRLSLPASESELIWKMWNRVGPRGGVEQQIDSQ